MGSREATPAEEYASDEDVLAAIGALSDVDSLRLDRIAGFRANALAGLGLGVGADDLIQEALARTLRGRRRWRKSVKFVTHMTKTISSIANHARDELRGGTVLAAAGDDPKDARDGVVLFSRLPDGERLAAANKLLAKIETKFADDTEVGLVLEGLANGMTGPEIQQDLEITDTRYETIVTRLRRGMKKEGWRP